MIGVIKVKLDLPENIKTQNIGSLLHGVLVEKLSRELQNALHDNSKYSPLKQRLYFINGQTVWEIVSFYDELSTELENFFNLNDSIFIKYHNANVLFEKIAMEFIDENKLLNDVYNSEIKSGIFKINFLSPTSHKSNGQYDIFPDVEKIFRSIMRMYDTFNVYNKMYDGETLEYITETVKIIGYRLNSAKFSLENVKIPSYRGSITIKVNGTIHFKKLVKFLLMYGEYSGVGIKTSLGMGKYIIED